MCECVKYRTSSNPPLLAPSRPPTPLQDNLFAIKLIQTSSAKKEKKPVSTVTIWCCLNQFFSFLSSSQTQNHQLTAAWLALSGTGFSTHPHPWGWCWTKARRTERDGTERSGDRGDDARTQLVGHCWSPKPLDSTRADNIAKCCQKIWPHKERRTVKIGKICASVGGGGGVAFGIKQQTPPL